MAGGHRRSIQTIPVEVDPSSKSWHPAQDRRSTDAVHPLQAAGQEMMRRIRQRRTASLRLDLAGPAACLHQAGVADPAELDQAPDFNR